jgi:EAL domain-containing protein (putative c-di-GMP-specific phosphodiesterase class I)
VCVEGIENEDSYNTVMRLGCQIGQGWYFGKPMQAEQARELLAGCARGDHSPLRSAVNG